MAKIKGANNFLVNTVWYTDDKIEGIETGTYDGPKAHRSVVDSNSVALFSTRIKQNQEISKEIRS